MADAAKPKEKSSLAGRVLSAVVGAVEMGAGSAMMSELRSPYAGKIAKAIWGPLGALTFVGGALTVAEGFVTGSQAAEAKGESSGTPAKPQSLSQRVLGAVGDVADGLTFGVASLALDAGEKTRADLAAARTAAGRAAADRAHHEQMTPMAPPSHSGPNRAEPHIAPNGTHHGWTDAARAASAQARGVQYNGPSR